MSTNLSVSTKALLVLSLIVASLLMLLWLALPARAATYTVTNTNDSGPGSLRQAITDANSSTGADLIVFQSGLSGTTSKLRTSANNHKLVDITATVQVNDSGSGTDPSPNNRFTLVSVTSNQADSGLGNGDVPNDIRNWTTGTADTSGQFRAERYRTDRIYTLTYRGKDVAGNTKNCQATVRVPKG